MRNQVTTVADLRAIVGEPQQAVANKVKDRLSPVQRDWLAHSPLGFVATTDAQGRVDVSPKGDPPGFVHVIDDTTIAIPERPGNKRVDGYLNVLQRPQVGTLFLIPGRGDTLRINGCARILSDADYFDALVVKGNRPILALEIDIEEVFFHCAKALCGRTPGTRRVGIRRPCRASPNSPRPSGPTGRKPSSRSTTATITIGSSSTRTGEYS